MFGHEDTKKEHLHKTTGNTETLCDQQNINKMKSIPSKHSYQ